MGGGVRKRVLKSFELEYTRSFILLSYGVMVSGDPPSPHDQDHYQHNVP